MNYSRDRHALPYAAVVLLVLLLSFGGSGLLARAAPPAPLPTQQQHQVHLPLIAGGAADGPSAQTLIAAALKAGRIDYGTSLLYRAYALFSDDRLPVELWGSGSDAEDQGLFHAMADSTLPAPVQAKLRPFLLRPDHPDSVHSAAGLQSLAAAPSAIPCDANGWAAQSSTKAGVKARVHAKCTAGYEADMAYALGQIESLWGPMTEHMGLPIADSGGVDGGGSTDIDLYLMEPLGKFWREQREQEISKGAMAVAPSAAPYPEPRSSGFMLLARKDLRAPIFKSVLAHEFFHVLQKAHNTDIQFHGNVEWWFVEASATWAEAHFVPETSGEEVHTRFEYQFQTLDDSLHRSVDIADLDTDEKRNRRSQMYAAYIWPFFMEQEVGADSIADAWRSIAEAGTSWDRGLKAIDTQLPFNLHFHRFALRNLNYDFDGDNPLGTRYIDLDKQFPDGAMPESALNEHLTAQKLSDPPLSYPDSIPSLEAHYYYFSVADDVRQVTFDLGKLAPLLDRKVDAVVKIRGKPWEVRDQLPDKLHFCRDKPDQDLEEIWLVVSDHNTDIATKVAGALEVRPLKEPCSCDIDQIARLTAVQEWRGSFSFSYERQARGSINGTDTSADAQNSGNVVINYIKPNPGSFPRSWDDRDMSGTAQVQSSYTQHRPNGLTGNLTGSGDVLPSGPGYNAPGSYFNVKDNDCTYNFVALVGLPATKTEFNTTGPTTVQFRFGVAGTAIPTDGLTLSGSMALPVILFEIDVSTGYRAAGFMGQMHDILGQGNLGTAMLSWEFTPVNPPQDLQARLTSHSPLPQLGEGEAPQRRG